MLGQRSRLALSMVLGAMAESKSLGMLKLVKLLKRWTENRSMEIPLHFPLWL